MRGVGDRCEVRKFRIAAACTTRPPWRHVMMIQPAQYDDLPTILSLYDHARALQRERGMVVWPEFDTGLLAGEIREGRQFVLSDGGGIECNWAVTWSDMQIWGARDRADAVYLHRICTHADARGKRHILRVVDWARDYARSLGRPLLRLDTLGHNTGLIRHYTSAGFMFLGMATIADTSGLPQHYRDNPRCCYFEMDVAT